MQSAYINILLEYNLMFAIQRMTGNIQNSVNKQRDREKVRPKMLNLETSPKHFVKSYFNQINLVERLIAGPWFSPILSHQSSSPPSSDGYLVSLDQTKQNRRGKIWQPTSHIHMPEKSGLYLLITQYLISSMGHFTLLNYFLDSIKRDDRRK